MEARFAQAFLLIISPALLGATYQTENFDVTAPTQEIAMQVARTAEHFRKQLAVEWLGHELQRWAAPCPVKVKVGQMGAGGWTTFSFFPNAKGSAEVCNWDMQVQGSLERILDSVLPHEISHTIFACHFRRPLPRWADEGAATLAEHDSEKRRQVLTVKQVMGSHRRIALKNLFNIKEYPKAMEDVLTLYAEGYSVAELLVQEGGRGKYLKFLADANRDGWDSSVHSNYGYSGVDDLEKHWQTWVLAGSPEIELPKGQQLAHAAKGKRAADQQKLVIRGQSPYEDPFLNEPAANAVASLGSIREPATAQKSDESRNRQDSVPLPLRAPPTRRQKKETSAAESAPVRQFVSSDRGNAEWTDDEYLTLNAEAGDSLPVADKPVRAVPRKLPKKTQVAENRSSPIPRQAAEWSEFPQDTRPSSVILRGRR